MCPARTPLAPCKEADKPLAPFKRQPLFPCRLYRLITLRFRKPNPAWSKSGASSPTSAPNTPTCEQFLQISQRLKSKGG